MNTESLDQTKEELKAILGREVTVSKVNFAGHPKFLVDYVNYSAPFSKLVGETEEEAIRNLFVYLKGSKDPATT